MVYKYGNFSSTQIREVKDYMRKQIYFLLLCVDPNTKEQYNNINVNEAFENLFIKLNGLNDLLDNPVEFVMVVSLLNAAFIEYKNAEFSYPKYRKLILDAGSEVLKIKEV